MFALREKPARDQQNLRQHWDDVYPAIQVTAGNEFLSDRQDDKQFEGSGRCGHQKLRQSRQRQQS
jgi:hypothetical protein